MSRKSLKGGQFERTICRQLSVWWSGDSEVDDLFWRSSQSGGRATTRAKKGKKTRGHCGDISATDSVGARLTKMVTIECKNGYPRAILHAALDRPTNGAEAEFTSFLVQAKAAANRAGSLYWWLIYKRDKRDVLIFVPMDFWNTYGSSHINDYIKLKIHARTGAFSVYGMKLNSFLGIVKASQLKRSK